MIVSPREVPMRLRATLLGATLLLLSSNAFASPILVLAQQHAVHRGVADGSAFSVPFFLSYFPLIDPTSHETIMLGAPFVPVGFEGDILFHHPEIDPLVARLTDHVEERLGESSFGLITFPPETSFYWGTDAIRDTWQVDRVRLRIYRSEVINHGTAFDYDLEFSWQILGNGDLAPSAVPEPSTLALLGVGSIAAVGRLMRRV